MNWLTKPFCNAAPRLGLRSNHNMEKETNMIARQGDVLLVKVDKVPAGLKSDNRQKCILAYGEVSGHHHRFEGGKVTAFYKEGDAGEPISGGSSLRGSATDVAFVSIPKEGASLIHEEHDAIQVAPGIYEVRRQREFDMVAGARRVAD